VHSTNTTTLHAITYFAYIKSIFTDPPPSKVGMASVLKLPVFKGVGNEEPGQFWFVVKAVWEAQGVTDENIKNASLVSAM